MENLQSLMLNEGGFGDERVAGAAAFQGICGDLVELVRWEVGVVEILAEHPLAAPGRQRGDSGLQRRIRMRSAWLSTTGRRKV